MAIKRVRSGLDPQAEQYFLSEATIKAHVSRLFSKLDVANRVQISILVHDADQS